LIYYYNTQYEVMQCEGLLRNKYKIISRKTDLFLFIQPPESVDRQYYLPISFISPYLLFLLILWYPLEMFQQIVILFGYLYCNYIIFILFSTTEILPIHLSSHYNNYYNHSHCIFDIIVHNKIQIFSTFFKIRKINY